MLYANCALMTRRALTPRGTVTEPPGLLTTTREELRIAVVTWAGRTYHRRRRQARLGRLTPVEDETMTNSAATLAA